ncbi:hypothetical protein B0H34DRAFT_800542 [Crassisporium funariophilum]|nr:hypothetical protein B0H34DRAFT_800542 [Crassisporium funariophilum]
MTCGDLIAYLSAWNQMKIAKAGGPEAWDKLSPSEQAECNKQLMTRIIQTFGKEDYDCLPQEDRRKLDLFIFEAGNKEMVLEWEKLGVEPPILLANKVNAAILRRLMDPGGPSESLLSEDEKRAFEESTCGGVKATALAGMILHNKDNKRGQGDRHIIYFKEKVDKDYTQFPPIHHSQFGSHGDAAANFLQYLEDYIIYFNILCLSKVNPTFTNVESNVLKALQDDATLTELCAMVLYQQAVSKPYMCIVRGSGSKYGNNVLDLAPLHVLVHEFVTKIIDKPELLVSSDASYVEGSLDGKEWDNSKAMEAVFSLMGQLPYVKPLTVAFFRGSSATWK